MAERKLEVRILGDSRDLERAFGRASSSAKKFDRNMSSVGRAASGLAKGFAIAAAGVSAIAVVGARELSEQAKVSAQTATVLRNVAKSAGITTKQVETMAGAMQAATGAQDDEIQSAANVILRFGLITKTGKAAEAQLRNMTTTALDLSVATGRDLSASAQALGRALADPTKAAGALRRAGIVLTSQQREQIKAMAESGNVAGAQAKVLDLVQSRVKGSAQAFGNTLPGQVQRAQRAFEDLSENTLAALAPALAKLAPVIVKAIQGIAPVIARVGSVVADLANELIANPAFREFAATVRDLLVRAVDLLAGAFRALAPLVIAVVAPIATLAAAVSRSRVAMTALTAAVAAFVALRVTAYVTGMVSAFRALAITQTAASGMRALTTATSALAFGMRGVTAQSVGLAPGLTAAAGGVSRFGVAANAAKGIVPGLGRAISGAFGGPVGIAITAGTVLATVIGGDLISSFTRAKDPAQRYADAMNEAAGATAKAKDSLAGLSDAMIGVGDAQDRTRDATKARVIAEKELRGLEAQGITSGPQYEAAVRNVSAARRDEARAMGEQSTATDTLKTKQGEVRGVLQQLVGGLSGAATAQRTLASGMLLGVQAGTVSKQAYADFLGTVNTRIMGSQELANFRTKAAEMAGIFRAQGTPQALAMANALDGISKARTPDAVRDYATQIVKLMGGSKADVDRITAQINNSMGKVGGVKPSTTWFDTVMGQIGTAGRALADFIRNWGNAPSGPPGKGSNGRKSSNELASAMGPNAQAFFYAQRSAAASAASGLSGIAREGFIARDPQAQAIAERRKGRKKDLEDLTRTEYKTRIAAAETVDEQKRLQMEYDEWEDSLLEESVNKRADKYEQDINNLASQFDRGEISAATFQAELSRLIGGDTGASNGELFGERWKAAFEAALGSGSSLQAIINNAMAGATGRQPIAGPEPEAAPETNPGGLYPQGRDFGPWRDKDERDRAFSKLSPELKKRAGKTRKGKEGDYRYGITIRPLAEGGILRRALLTGEAGPEAIVPLTGTRGVAYMARVMDEVMRSRGGGTRVVNVTFEGVIDAREAARRIKPEIDRIVSLT